MGWWGQKCGARNSVPHINLETQVPSILPLHPLLHPCNSLQATVTQRYILEDPVWEGFYGIGLEKVYTISTMFTDHNSDTRLHLTAEDAGKYSLALYQKEGSLGKKTSQHVSHRDLGSLSK